MEKYCQAAYEYYRQDVKENYLSYEAFKKELCKTASTTPWWVYLAGGAAIGYSLKK
jgi:hypothetical protein